MNPPCLILIWWELDTFFEIYPLHRFHWQYFLEWLPVIYWDRPCGRYLNCHWPPQILPQETGRSFQWNCQVPYSFFQILIGLLQQCSWLSPFVLHPSSFQSPVARSPFPSLQYLYRFLLNWNPHFFEWSSRKEQFNFQWSRLVSLFYLLRFLHRLPFESCLYFLCLAVVLPTSFFDLLFLPSIPPPWFQEFERYSCSTYPESRSFRHS